MAGVLDVMKTFCGTEDASLDITTWILGCMIEGWGRAEVGSNGCRLGRKEPLAQVYQTYFRHCNREVSIHSLP
jgi:hypothetical protein